MGQAVALDKPTVFQADRAQDHNMKTGGLCVFNIDAWYSHSVEVDGTVDNCIYVL